MVRRQRRLSMGVMGTAVAAEAAEAAEAAVAAEAARARRRARRLTAECVVVFEIRMALSDSAYASADSFGTAMASNLAALVSSGSFTSALQTHAAASGSTALASASATEVTTTLRTRSPSPAPTPPPSSAPAPAPTLSPATGSGGDYNDDGGGGSGYNGIVVMAVAIGVVAALTAVVGFGLVRQLRSKRRAQVMVSPSKLGIGKGARDLTCGETAEPSGDAIAGASDNAGISHASAGNGGSLPWGGDESSGRTMETPTALKPKLAAFQQGPGLERVGGTAAPCRPVELRPVAPPPGWEKQPAMVAPVDSSQPR